MGGAWQNITMIGEGLQSGFDSEHKGRLFRLNGGGNLTFKNLTFQNGRDLVNDGGNGSGSEVTWSQHSKIATLCSIP